jgi:hypothetical protein
MTVVWPNMAEFDSVHHTECLETIALFSRQREKQYQQYHHSPFIVVGNTIVHLT